MMKKMNVKKMGIMLLTLALLACCLTGCQAKNAPKADANATSSLAEYLVDIEIQNHALRISLEKDAVTQADMNQKSKELCDLWESAMNHLLEEAKKILPEAELARLKTEQTDWEKQMIADAEKAGKEYEDGSIRTLVVNSERAKLTEERVYKLYEGLKKSAAK